MISSLINCFLIGVLFADMIERRFPEEFKNMVITTSMNLIFIFSKAQIYFIKMNNQLNKFIEGNPTLLKFKNDLDAIMKPKSGTITMTEFIKNGEIINTIENPETVLDFTLLSWLNDNDRKCVVKKIIYDEKEPMTISELSDIKFMLIEIKIGDNSPHKIDLKTDNFNYYVVGNKFTKQFFIFYLKYYLKISEPINETDSFSIKILDHNVNTFQMDFTDKNESIILHKNDYIAELNNDN